MKPNEKPTEPMQAYLAGALHGALLAKDSARALKIVAIEALATATGFQVVLASGLHLRANVEVVPSGEDPPP